ncbi:winged helix-turn-helix transcriptional regulator [Cupriavidus sp. TA19]
MGCAPRWVAGALIQQLKQLEKDGIVRRTVFPQVPPKV